MALTMDKAEYGRDQKAINALVNEMEAKINTILKSVNVDCNEYKNIEAAIKECWVGKDADNFLKALKTKNTTVYNNIKETKTKFSTYFKDDEAAFAKFQEKNTII